MRVPGAMSSCASIVAVPYSSAYETDAAGRGSLPALRIGTSPTSAAIAIAPASRNPRASTPATTSNSTGERLDHGVDHGAQGRGIRQQRSDVAELDPRLGIVGDRADERLGAGEGGHRPTLARDSREIPGSDAECKRLQ